MAAEKYYTPEEFEQVMADLSDGLITVRIYEDGIVVDRMDDRCSDPRAVSDGSSAVTPRFGGCHGRKAPQQGSAPR
jgi:hypothetical protein